MARSGRTTTPSKRLGIPARALKCFANAWFRHGTCKRSRRSLLGRSWNSSNSSASSAASSETSFRSYKVDIVRSSVKRQIVQLRRASSKTRFLSQHRPIRPTSPPLATPVPVSVGLVADEQLLREDLCPEAKIIYVGNITHGMTNAMVKDFFERTCGSVVSARIRCAGGSAEMLAKHAESSTYYAVVNFKHRASAVSAMNIPESQMFLNKVPIVAALSPCVLPHFTSWISGYLAKNNGNPVEPQKPKLTALQSASTEVDISASSLIAKIPGHFA